MAEKAGAEGILYQDCTPLVNDYEKVPSVRLTKDEVKEIHKLIRYTKLILKLKTDCSYRYITLFFFYSKHPNSGTPIEATIYRSRMVDNPNPFIVAKFSSRGPNPITNEILKVSKSL